MKFLNHLDLVENEARRLKMYRVDSGAYTPGVTTSGNIIMDTSSTLANIPKWWDGSQWRDFSYGTAGSGAWNIQSDSGSNIAVHTTDTLDLTGGVAMSTATSGSATNPVVTLNVLDYGASPSVTGASADGDNKWYGVKHHPTTGKLQVHVPWVDTTVANTNTVTSLRANNTGTYRTGNINLVNGSNVTITETSAGVFNFAATNTQIAARLAGVGLTLNGNTFDVNTWGAIAGTLNATTGETAGKYYKVHTDANDKLIVNVPWENTTTNTQNAYSTSIPTSTTKLRLTGSGAAGATTDDIEFVGSGATSVTRTNDSKFTIASTNSQYTAGANVTLIGGAFSTAGALTNQSLGLAKTAYGALNNTTLASMGSEAAGRVYGIQKNTANQLVVQVPWSDTTTNTQATYTLPVAAGAGNTAIINLTGGGAASGIASAVTFSGTANEVAITESVGNNGTITIGLPDDVTIGNDLTVTNDALVSGDLTVTGDLTVNGTTTTLNTSVLEVEDNFVEINKVVSGASAANTANFGVTGERGSLANVSLKWIESSDTWFLDESSTNQNAGSLVSKKIIQEIWRNVNTNSGTASHTQYTTNNTLNILGSNGITTSATGQTVTVNGGSLTQGTVATLAASSMSSNLTANVTHALATKDVVVRTYLVNGDDYDEVYADLKIVSTTVVRLTFSATPTANVRVVITAVKTPLAGTSVAYA